MTSLFLPLFYALGPFRSLDSRDGTLQAAVLRWREEPATHFYHCSRDLNGGTLKPCWLPGFEKVV